MRASCAFCVAGWLAIYFAQVLMANTLYTFTANNSLVNLWRYTFCLVSIIIGAMATGLREAGNGIWNGSIFLCGM